MTSDLQATNTPPRIWVLDSTFLWGMSSVDLLTMAIDHCAGRLRVTPTVEREIARRAASRPFLNRALAAIRTGAIEQVTLSRAEGKLAASLHSSLWMNSPHAGKDLGEAETIAVAGLRGWHAVIDERKARVVLPMRFRGSDCYCTPQVVLALAASGRLTMEEAHEKLQAMTRGPNFQHEFAGATKARWMNAASYYGVTRL